MKYILYSFSILIGLFFLRVSQANAASCAVINSVSVNTSQVQSQQPFKCQVTVDNQFAGSSNIACGISIDDQWPTSFCPSDNFFGGWQGNQATFNCIIPNVNFTTKNVKVAAFDFQQQCGPKTGKSALLTFNSLYAPSGDNSSSSSSQDNQRSTIDELLRLFINTGGSTDTPNDSSNPSYTPPANLSNGDHPAPKVSRVAEAQRTLAKCGISSQTSVDGPPTITVEKMRQVLQSYHSPTVNDAQAFYNLGVQYNINPAAMLAFFIQESSAGTQGSSVRNKSIGNIVCTSGNCPGRFQNYSSWVESAQAWYQLIHNLYIDKWGLYNVETIIPIYAPSFENNTCIYINNVLNRINSWK